MFLLVLQDSELVNLVMGFVSVLIMIQIFRKSRLPEFNLVYLGFFAIIFAYIFTVVEGIIWKDFFNFLEHLSYAVAGLVFALGSFSIYRLSKIGKDKSEED